MRIEAGTPLGAPAPPARASEPRPVPEASQAPEAPEAPRNRYLDTLRAAALGRVLLFHLFGWVWLPLLFPSMGVMFALAGSLMAASLDRSPAARRVLGRRLRRLLPPLWAFGLVLVPVMLAMGWTATTDGAQPLGWTLGSWVLPLTEPPGSDLGYDWTLPLWYLRTYLWLVLLSPALLWLWRHWPRTLHVLPFLGLLLLSGGLVGLEGVMGEGLASVLVFTPCWLVGFAHHDGRLQQVRLSRILLLGTVLCAAGVGWALRYPLPDQPVPDVSDIPLAAALFNLGFGLVLLRLPLTLSFVERVPVLRGMLDIINRRALTIYLWGNVAVWVVTELPDRYGVTALLPGGAWEPWVVLGATLGVLAVIVLGVGWVEDLAARRPPRLLPLDRPATRAGRAPRTIRSDRLTPSPVRTAVTTKDGTG